nr:MAG TPA: hypothetical protein [Caudoviricetes sp.]
MLLMIKVVIICAIIGVIWTVAEETFKKFNH